MSSTPAPLKIRRVEDLRLPQEPVSPDEPKYTRLSDSRRVFTWRENEACSHPSFEAKMEIFGGKRILVSGGIMLGSRTRKGFDSSTVNSQRYRYDILEAYDGLGEKPFLSVASLPGPHRN
ncbi:hypothetical protein TNCV_3321771 [Trichonephila clavipes]|nr:hypothetical protein TNCV_3321771 [Trichonephila clavipes]